MIAAVALLLSSCAPIGPTGYPAVAVNENTAYLANGTGIYAIDVRNGTLVWRYPEKQMLPKFYLLRQQCSMTWWWQAIMLMCCMP